MQPAYDRKMQPAACIRSYAAILRSYAGCIRSYAWGQRWNTRSGNHLWIFI